MRTDADTPELLDESKLVKRSVDGHVRVYELESGLQFAIDTSSSKNPQVFPFNDIFATVVEGVRLRVEACSRVSPTRRTCIRRKVKAVQDPFARRKLSHVVEFSNDMEATEWHSYIKSLIRPSYVSSAVGGGHSDSTSSRSMLKLLVVINPIGGKQRGLEMYQRLLKPMLDVSETLHEVIITKGPGHAMKIAGEFDPSVFGAICVIGGDGLFGEILNGLYSRPDKRTILETPLGVIPAGSSNCLACSVGLGQPLAAAFAIVKGIVKPLDVLKISLQSSKQVILSVCGISYGFISEVNTHAGKWRWLFGPSRYTVCGVKTLLTSPLKYHVDCYYMLPSRETIESYEKRLDSTACGPDCDVCKSIAEERVGVESDSSCNLDFESAEEIGELWIHGSIEVDPQHKQTGEQPVHSDNPTSSSTMLLFSLTNLSIRQSQNNTVWNRQSHRASGLMDLVMMPVISRFELLRFFNAYAKGNESHKKLNAFSIIKANSVVMKNGSNTPAWEKNIQIAIDGEVFPVQPLRVDSIHGLVRLMCC